MPIDRYQARTIAMQIVSNAIGYRKIAKSSANGNSDLVEYHAGDPDQEVGAQPVRRMEPFGLHSVPPEGLPAVVVFANASPHAGMIVGVDGTKYFPADYVAGEVALYCKATGTVIKLDQNGAITITAAANQNINVTASGTGQVNVSASAITGKVGLGPVANLSVLVQGAFDSMGVPVTQAPAAIATIVKAG